MVFVWSQLCKGDPYFTLSQVALNDAIMVVAFAPIVALLLGLSSITVPWDTLLTSVGLYIVIPVILAQLWRKSLLSKGTQHFQSVASKLGPFSIAALLLTLVLLFAFQGEAILPKAAPQEVPELRAAAETSAQVEPASSLKATLALSFVFAATWFISTAMAAHLPRLLQAAGVSLAGAVLVGALIGPAQVGARLLEFGFLRKVHPLLSARLAAAMHPLGVMLFALLGAPAAVVFGILHGAGNGILTIAKGTLPLVIFGPQGYGQRQGLLMGERLAFPP